DHTHPSTLSLHDALPIFSHRMGEGSIQEREKHAPCFAFCVLSVGELHLQGCHRKGASGTVQHATTETIPRPSPPKTPPRAANDRSEEHTSELQSRFDLVC